MSSTVVDGYAWYYVQVDNVRGYVRGDCVQVCNADGSDLRNGGPRRGEYARNGDGDACNDGLRLRAAGGRQGQPAHQAWQARRRSSWKWGLCWH